MYKVPYLPYFFLSLSSLYGKNIKLFREEGKNIKLFRGEGNKKRKRRRNIIIPILRLFGRISMGGEGKGTEILG